MTKEEFQEVYSRLKLDVANLDILEEGEIELGWETWKNFQNERGRPLTSEEYESFMRPQLEEVYRNDSGA